MIAGIGIDHIEVDRIKKAVEKGGERFLRRIFTEEEIEYCGKKKRLYECFASRFAAKEAVFKALKPEKRSGIKWKEIEIRRKKSGEPLVKLHGKASLLAKKNGISRIFISISHINSSALSEVILEKDGES